MQSQTSDDANIANFDYTYNNRDVRTSEEKTLGSGSAQTINYTYDDIDQLTKEESTEATPVIDNSYTYDAAGNRITSVTGSTSTAYTTNNLNQLTQTTIGGNNTALTYDANGNMISEGSKTFGYNDADELTSVVVPGQTKSTFEYDSDGLKRISTEYTWDANANSGAGGWTQSDETRYIYDGMDLVQEQDVQGNVKASFVRDGNIGGVLSMTNADGTFDYHYDGNGNVVALTDSNQNIVAQYSYDAYGNLISSSGSEADNNPFRFSSKYYDSDTGLYDYGARYYDPSLGRWLNRDPLGVSGGLNLYGFVGNDPGDAVDSYGLSECRNQINENLNGSSGGFGLHETNLIPPDIAPPSNGYNPSGKWWDIPNQLKNPKLQPWLHAWNMTAKLLPLLGIPDEPIIPLPDTEMPEFGEVHGNSLRSQRPTWGYKLYSNDGTFLKNGITSREVPESRYTKNYMGDKYMDSTKFPNRKEAYDWEYNQNMKSPGPLNFERYLKSGK